MLVLSSPLSVGDADATQYTHVRITMLVWDSEREQIDMYTRAGTVDSGTFVPGVEIVGVTSKRISVANTQTEIDGEAVELNKYDDFVAKLTSSSGVAIYDEVARECYQFMVDEGIYAGSIDP